MQQLVVPSGPSAALRKPQLVPWDFFQEMQGKSGKLTISNHHNWMLIFVQDSEGSLKQALSAC